MSDSEDELLSPCGGGERKVTVAVRMRPKKSTGPERYDSACVRIDHGAAAIDLAASFQGAHTTSTRESNASAPDRIPSFTSSNGGVSPGGVKGSPHSPATHADPTVTIADPEGKIDALGFAFDKVFDETDDQETVFQEVVHGPVVTALETGGDALFVAYGQTGSGKTYTMLGEDARYVGSSPSASGPSLSPTSVCLSPSSTLRNSQQSLTSPSKAQGGTAYFNTISLDGPRHEVGAGAGVLMRVMHTVLQYKEQREGSAADKQWHVVIAMSAVEVYNDSLFDLLAANGGARANIKTGPNARNVELDAREFGDDLFITNLQRFVITDTSHVQAVFEIALRNRSVAPTQMNDTSSRSHAIFTTEVFLQRRTASNPDPPDPGLMAEHLITNSFALSRTGRMSNTVATATPSSPHNSPSNDFASFPFTASRITMVDLAGNERVKKSGVSGKELNEAVAVNKSLSALGHVVHQICQGAKHISFRDSKVTRLLRSAFANPKSKIVFITNIAPIGMSYPETVCSLRFAARLKELKPIASVSDSLKQQNAIALKEDQMLQRLHVFEQLCADFRILQQGYQYVPQVARWRRFTGNNRLTARIAAAKYGDEVKEFNETRRVLELEQMVQELAASIRLSSSTALPDTDSDNDGTLRGLGGTGAWDGKASKLHREIEELEVANEDERKEILSVQASIEKMQEQSNLANRLMGSKSDAERLIQEITKESEMLDAKIKAQRDPRQSDYAKALEELAQEKAGRERDEGINTSNTQFATKLLEHNRSKIAVRTERIEQISLRNAIDSYQQQIMSLYNSSTLKQVKVPSSTLANSESMDMKRILEICTTPRHAPYPSSTREDPLLNGPEALEQCMTKRLKHATNVSHSSCVSPIVFYVSPETATRLSKYLEQGAGQTTRVGHGRAPSVNSNHLCDSDDDTASEVTGDATAGQSAAHLSNPTALFDALSEEKKEMLGDSIKLFLVHGRVLALLDDIHTTRLVDNAKLRLLFSLLDQVPIDGLAAESIVLCAKRSAGEGSDDDSSEWSGDELESNLNSSVSVYRSQRGETVQREGRENKVAGMKTGNGKPTISDATRRVLKRLLENPTSPSNAALIRCIQAHSLFGRVDSHCDPFPDSPHAAMNKIILEVRRRAFLRRVLDVSSTPIGGEAPPPNPVPPSSTILPDDSLDAFVNQLFAPEISSQVTFCDCLGSLCYLSQFASASTSHLMPRMPSAGPSALITRDLSLIAFYGSKIIDSAGLMSPTPDADGAIPYMPSTVRFAETLLMCCGYGR